MQSLAESGMKMGEDIISVRNVSMEVQWQECTLQIREESIITRLCAVD